MVTKRNQKSKKIWIVQFKKMNFNLNQKSKRSRCIRKEFQTQSEAKKFLSENQKKHHLAEIFELEKMGKN